MRSAALRAPRISALLVATLMLAGSAEAQAPLNFTSDYVVRIYGLTVGRASFQATIAGDNYRVNGTLRSAGLARIFDQTDANARASGRVQPGKVTPERFVLDFVQGGRKTTTDISFRRGNVASTRISPEPKPGKKLVPVSRSDLRSVADPVSAALIARGTPQEVCGRTLRVYEGATRIDVKLSLAGVGQVDGVGANAVTCRADVRPVSGYEQGNATFNYIRDKGDMRLVYAPVGRGLYALHSLSTRTEIGRVELLSSRRTVGS